MSNKDEFYLAGLRKKSARITALEDALRDSVKEVKPLKP